MNKDDMISRVLPQFFPAHWLDSPGIVFNDFPSRIRIGYVVRGEGNCSYVCEEELSQLSMTLQELHNAALKNLANLPSANISIGKVPGGAEGWISAADDNFAAVRILLSNIQRVFQQEIGDEFLLSIPHRDDCFCWSPAQPSVRQQKHERDALAAFIQEEYNLTPDVLLFRQGRFQLHREQVLLAEDRTRPNNEP